MIPIHISKFFYPIMKRRDFLKALGAGTATVAGAALAGCDNDKPAGKQPGEMTMRVNPNTGDSVSILGYGMMRLPTVDSQGSAREDGEAEIDQEMVNRQVDYALEHGVNYFDTSPAYCRGRSEHSTGIALSRHPRDKYYIATKLSNFNPETWSHEAGVEMFQNSLKELQTDYIDYLLLHAIGMGKDGMAEFEARYIDNGILDYLIEQKQKGTIRNLGFSYHGDIAVFDHALQMHDRGEVHWDFVQIELNYLDWEHAKEINPRNTNAVYLYDELDRRGIPAVIMEPLLGGRLSHLPEPLAKRLLSRDPEASVASWAFRYAGTRPRVLTVLSGMTLMEHLVDNVATYSPLVPLTDDELAMLEKLGSDLVGYHTVPCNDCKYCMPCPYGIDIPAIFIHYNKCLSEGAVPDVAERPGQGQALHGDAKASTSDNYRRARRDFLIGVDRAVPRMRQADKCIGCGQCSPHCPQRIDIPRELHRISDIIEQVRSNP